MGVWPLFTTLLRRSLLLTTVLCLVGSGFFLAPALAANVWQPAVNLDEREDPREFVYGVQVGMGAQGEAVAAWHRSCGRENCPVQFDRLESRARPPVGPWGERLEVGSSSVGFRLLMDAPAEAMMVNASPRLQTP